MYIQTEYTNQKIKEIANKSIPLCYVRQPANEQTHFEIKTRGLYQPLDECIYNML